MEKLFIENRKGQKIAVLIERPESPRGLAFVMHGLGSRKEATNIQVLAEVFFENQYTVVRFDAVHSFGESEGGLFEDATPTNYYEDFQDVIAWSKTQDLYQEPFCLAGHSLGGISTSLFAEKHPEMVKGLAPLSTTVSGKLSLESPEYLRVGQQWEKTGWYERESVSNPGLIRRLKYAYVEDRLKYDLLPNVSKLTMPVLMIVGSEDQPTPPEHQKILFDSLPGKKELHVVPGAPHTFRKKEHLDQVKEFLNNWIKNVLD
jgi:uncharacterized protein